MPASRALAFIIKEFKEVIPPTVFFEVGFNLIVLTTQLFLDDYGRQFASFMIATAAALVVGKSVLVANALPLLRRFDGAPRQRIRTLVKLSRLTEMHTADELRDRNTAVHAELIDLLGALAKRATSPSAKAEIDGGQANRSVSAT